ncbi:MAG: hypothetical protein AB1349_14005 [Elusimicrobiota bacterium]
MNTEELLKESLKVYLIQRLYKIESELFLLRKKYGVKDMEEFNKKVSHGILSEEKSYDDYFLFDNLQDDRNKIMKFLEQF